MKRYFPSMKRYSWIVVICVVLTTLAGVYLAKSQPTSYIVTSTLIINAGAPGTTYPGFSATTTDSIPQADNDAVEIPTRSVLEFIYLSDPRIHERHYSPDDLLVDITVAAPSTTTSNIIITATALTPSDAVMLATDAARGYKAYKDMQVQDQLNTTRAALEGQKQALETQKINLENQINKLPSTSVPSYTVLSNNLIDTTHNIDTVETQLLDLPQTVLSDVFIVQLPKVTDVTASSKALLVIAVTAGLGLVLGFLIMLLVIFFDNRLYGEDRVKDKLGYAYLGGLSTNSELKNSPMRASGVALKDIADISANLRLAEVLPDQWRAPHGVVLLVTSNRSAEGKTTVVSALAAAIARGGSSVAVVEGNLRQPTTHLAYSISPTGIGLGGLLRGNGTESIDHAVQRSNEPGVWLLAGGSAMDNPTYLLSQKFPAILDQLRRKVDLVMIDAPPLLSGADTAILATMVDGIAFVIDARYDKMPLLLRAKEILSSVENVPVGVILNRLPRRKKNRYFVAAYPGKAPAEKRETIQTLESNGQMNGNGQKPNMASVVMTAPPSSPAAQQVRPSTWVPVQELEDTIIKQQNPPSSRPPLRRKDMMPLPPMRTGKDG